MTLIEFLDKHFLGICTVVVLVSYFFSEALEKRK